MNNVEIIESIEKLKNNIGKANIKKLSNNIKPLLLPVSIERLKNIETNILNNLSLKTEVKLIGVDSRYEYSILHSYIFTEIGLDARNMSINSVRTYNNDLYVIDSTNTLRLVVLCDPEGRYSPYLTKLYIEEYLKENYLLDLFEELQKFSNLSSLFSINYSDNEITIKDNKVNYNSHNNLKLSFTFEVFITHLYNSVFVTFKTNSLDNPANDLQYIFAEYDKKVGLLNIANKINNRLVNLFLKSSNNYFNVC